MVAALAHRAGAKVIGSAGSDEKVKYLLEELKFEAAFNYKTEDTDEVCFLLLTPNWNSSDVQVRL